MTLGRRRDRHEVQCLVIAFLTLLVAPANAAVTVTLDITPDAVQFAGTPAALHASASHTGGGTILYQFSYRRTGGIWRVLRDFHIPADVDWSVLEEGSYELRVRARAVVSGEMAEVVRPYSVHLTRNCVAAGSADDQSAGRSL